MAEMNDEEEKVWREFRAKQQRHIDSLAEPKVNRYQATAENARRELHRYILGGAAFGLGILLNQFEAADSTGRAFITIGLTSFVGSLFCSYKTMEQIWLEGWDSVAAWRKWQFNEFERLEKDIERARAGDIAQSEFQDEPSESTARQDKWSNWAAGLFFGGCTGTIVYFATQIDWPIMEWVGSLMHRVANTSS